ncbi:MAG: 6-carboxytetrahydropterin synthase [Crocinitomicaceae bacterium]|nr:6-carboxytetrahydropterin synthase [Crocinitomicaceae bacterium]
MIHITRRERFSSAHRLFVPEWSMEDNDDFFGACNNPNWHGHNYELFVTIKGEVNQQTGVLINLKDLSKILNEKVISKVDHKNLNTEVSFLKDCVTSAEMIAIRIWNEIEEPIRDLGAELYKVKLIETENNYVEYYG